MAICGNNPAVDRLLRAIGVAVPVQKVVIEIDFEDAVKVYVKALADERVMERATELIEVIAVDAVEVADDCTVVAVPRET